jgi:hypothetical protein
MNSLLRHGPCWLIAAVILVILAGSVGGCNRPAPPPGNAQQEWRTYWRAMHTVYEKLPEVRADLNKVSGSNVPGTRNALRMLRETIVPSVTQMRRTAESVQPTDPKIRTLHQELLAGLRPLETGVKSLEAGARTANMDQLSSVDSNIQEANPHLDKALKHAASLQKM